MKAPKFKFTKEQRKAIGQRLSELQSRFPERDEGYQLRVIRFAKSCTNLFGFCSWDELPDVNSLWDLDDTSTKEFIDTIEDLYNERVTAIME